MPSPAWHGEVLEERERLVAEGKAAFSDWEKARGRVAARCHEDPDSRPRRG
ncbi:MAG: addiction module protein [Verrucomicrobiota bacterium]|nr:addiction module protein [Verrucomicrobiota bacterium]